MANEKMIKEMQEEAYNKGLNDAWEFMKKCFYAYTGEECEEIFGKVIVEHIVMKYTPQEALAKLKVYEEAQEIKVGDVITDENHKVEILVTEIIKQVPLFRYECELEKGRQSDLFKALYMAIQALEEIQQYRAIGTIEEFKALKENQRNCKDCAGCTTWKCDCANVRAKAIDEFVKEIRDWQIDIQDNEYDADKFDFVFERIYEIAEEMRGAE